MARTCAEFQDDLSALLDNELKDADKVGLETHLTECKDCASRFETLKALSGFMREQVDVDIKMPDLWDSIKEDMASVCEVMQDDLSAYLDGELPPAAQEGVKQHLADCQNCLDKFKLLNRTNQL
ncbi:MAG: zf-HC2 domain-containing protein, partial [Candidatus Obscuribacterales bacterium]|nr:zf-HC2 domain-containing protein [Candidatus Obscuribacterales bacterium]